jgi:hypothetical protein
MFWTALITIFPAVPRPLRARDVRSEEKVTGSTMKPARRSQVNRLASMFVYNIPQYILGTSIFILIQSFMRTVSCTAGILSGCRARFAQATTSPRLRARGGGSDAPRGEVLPAPRGLFEECSSSEKGEMLGLVERERLGREPDMAMRTGTETRKESTAAFARFI